MFMVLTKSCVVFFFFFFVLLRNIFFNNTILKLLTAHFTTYVALQKLHYLQCY